MTCITERKAGGIAPASALVIQFSICAGLITAQILIMYNNGPVDKVVLAYARKTPDRGWDIFGTYLI